MAPKIRLAIFLPLCIAAAATDPALPSDQQKLVNTQCQAVQA